MAAGVRAAGASGSLTFAVADCAAARAAHGAAMTSSADGSEFAAEAAGVSWHEKQRIALRYWLLGAGYRLAADAMAFAEQRHVGVRKDGTTPEFAHQIAVAHYVRTLTGSLLWPQETIVVALLHDVREDYGVPDAVLRARFGPVVADAVDAMTKEFDGVRRAPEAVFQAIAADPVASVAKAADRINNQNSMLGVFSPAKVAEYVAETEEFFLPMLKAARKRFPTQEPAYENAKLVLESQLRMLRALLAA